MCNARQRKGVRPAPVGKAQSPDKRHDSIAAHLLVLLGFGIYFVLFGDLSVLTIDCVTKGRVVSTCVDPQRAGLDGQAAPPGEDARQNAHVHGYANGNHARALAPCLDESDPLEEAAAAEAAEAAVAVAVAVKGVAEMVAVPKNPGKRCRTSNPNSRRCSP